MVEAATEFKKSGFTDEDSAILARIATLYQNVADNAISAGDSAGFIIAQMKAFNIEADNAQHIIDAVNEVQSFGASVNRVNCGETADQPTSCFLTRLQVWFLKPYVPSLCGDTKAAQGNAMRYGNKHKDIWVIRNQETVEIQFKAQRLSKAHCLTMNKPVVTGEVSRVHRKGGSALCLLRI